MKGIDELICKAEIETQGTNVWIPRRKGVGGSNRDTGIDTDTLLIVVAQLLIMFDSLQNPCTQILYIK